jgi:hypothetical protein
MLCTYFKYTYHKQYYSWFVTTVFYVILNLNVFRKMKSNCFFLFCYRMCFCFTNLILSPFFFHSYTATKWTHISYHINNIETNYPRKPWVLLYCCFIERVCVCLGECFFVYYVPLPTGTYVLYILHNVMLFNTNNKVMAYISFLAKDNNKTGPYGWFIVYVNVFY